MKAIHKHTFPVRKNYSKGEEQSANHCKLSEILKKGNNLFCPSFMDTGRRPEILRSETKDSFCSQQQQYREQQHGNNFSIVQETINLLPAYEGESQSLSPGRPGHSELLLALIEASTASLWTHTPQSYARQKLRKKEFWGRIIADSPGDFSHSHF